MRIGSLRTLRPAPVAAALGVLVDAVVGDPPDRWHPTAWFGTAMNAFERRAHADSVARGALHAAAGAGAGLAAGALVPPAVATAVAVGATGLGRAARRIADPLGAGDVVTARERLPWLVGRDPAGLGTTEVARATVESVAENCVDALVAPALWAAVLGAPGVAVHRAVNTMDAMVGHRSERHMRYGRVSARSDDVMAWVPARATALLVAAVRPQRAVAVARAVVRDARAHPSPNSGVAEAAFAAALDVRLGGENRYGDRVEHRPVLHPSGRPVGPHDIERAVRLLGHVRAVLVVALLATSVVARRSSGGRGGATGRPYPRTNRADTPGGAIS